MDRFDKVKLIIGLLSSLLFLAGCVLIVLAILSGIGDHTVPLAFLAPIGLVLGGLGLFGLFVFLIMYIASKMDK